MAGYLFAPLAGAFVAASLSYSLRHEIQTDSQALAASLREAKQTLLEADEQLTTGKTATERRRAQPLPASYVRPAQPSMGEEIKARWNEHLTSFIRSASQIDWAESAEKAYNRIRGVAEEKVAPAVQQAAASLSTSTENVASGTLRDPVKAKADVRLFQPNTHYLGQGASLR